MLLKRFSSLSGATDPAFGNSGSFVLRAGFYYPRLAQSHAVAVSPDGSLTVIRRWTCPSSVLGISCMLITRLTPSGHEDGTFGIGGNIVAQLPEYEGREVNFVRILPDGKLLLATEAGGNPDYWQNYWHVYRFDALGSADASFHTPTLPGETFGPFKVESPAFLLPYPDGRFLFAGTSSIGRYLADGTFDPSFNLGSPVVNIHWTASAIQADGGFVLARDLLVFHRDSSGARDFAFGTSDGYRTLAVGAASRIAVQGDGKILVAGWTADRVPFVTRLTPTTGADDTTFADAGIRRVSGVAVGDRPTIDAILIQPDGKIVVAGTDGTFDGTNIISRGFVFRLTADGDADASFGTDKIAYVNVSSNSEFGCGTSPARTCTGALQAPGKQLRRAYRSRNNSDGRLWRAVLASIHGFGRHGALHVFHCERRTTSRSFAFRRRDLRGSRGHRPLHVLLEGIGRSGRLAQQPVFGRHLLGRDAGVELLHDHPRASRGCVGAEFLGKRGDASVGARSER